MISIDAEVEACFRDNPELYKRSPAQIAKFFMMQGELRYSNLSNIQRNRANFYRRQLSYLDPELCERADEELEKARG